MASARASRLCSKCKDAAGTVNCAGCKEIFCLKHVNEHREELSTRMEQLRTEQAIVVQQVQDKESQKKSLKQHLYGQIEEWQNTIIEKVRERAEEIRRQVDELMDMKKEIFDTKEEILDNDIHLLTDEIRTRQEKDAFFEDDLERIAQTIRKFQQAIDESIQQSGIEIHTEQSEKIDWENLIYIQEKPNTTISLIANNHHVSEDGNETREINHSNSTPNLNHCYTTSACFTPSSSYTPNKTGPINQWFPVPSNTSQMSASASPFINGTPKSSTPRDKRERTPLLIVDPDSKKPVDLPASSQLSDTSSNPSTKTEELQ